MTSENDKWYMLVCVIASNFICGTLYLNITSFYPLYCENNYKDYINTTMIAVAMSSFELSGVIFSPLHAATVSVMGRKNAILIGMMILLLTNTGMALLSLFDGTDWKWFFSLSIIIRFI